MLVITIIRIPFGLAASMFPDYSVDKLDEDIKDMWREAYGYSD